MYNQQASVPLVVRTPMGGRRGYGPTHSQTLEKLFLGVPGLRVLAPCALGDPGKLLHQAIFDDDPVLFIENKLLYLLRTQEIEGDSEFEIQERLPEPENSHSGVNPYAPTYILKVRGAPQAALTLATYGYMVELARQAALRLAYDQEIFVELVAPTQLAPFATAEILESVGRTRRLLTLEEGTRPLGWGAEIVSQAAQALGPRLLASDRIAALNLPVPASGLLEANVLPDIESILAKCQKIVIQR